MKKTIFLLIFLLILFNNKAFSQSDGWYQRNDFIRDVGDMFYKQDGKIKYTFYSDVSMEERNSMISLTNRYIKENLAILKELELNDSIDIILVRNRNDMITHVGAPISGLAFTSVDEFVKQKLIISIGGDRNPLKHELMHMVSECKWGTPDDYNRFSWLQEGLATYADPKAECDNYSFEEKYVYLIQSKKLISGDSLLNQFDAQYPKIAYNQSAYIVKLLIDNYGIDCFKKLWTGTMADFATIYGVSFDDFMKMIEIELKEKYPDPIKFDWSEFEKTCY